MKFFSSSFIFSFFAPIITLAFGETPKPPCLADVHPMAGPTTITDWFLIVQNVTGWLFTFTIIFGVAAFIVAGIMYITAAGSDRARTAGRIVLYAFIGIAIAALAWAIVNLIGNTFVGHVLLDTRPTTPLPTPTPPPPSPLPPVPCP